jgi:predicted secreted protein
MAGQNGAIVLLKVNVSTSSGDDFQFIGGQTNLSINETTAEIDVSDKLSGRLGERVPGRAKANVSVNLHFLRSDPTIVYLKDKYRNREQIEVMVFDRANLDAVDSVGEITGDSVESASGIIVNFSETHPDQDKSTVSLEISLNNDWVPASSGE